jgi:hypothetical protein
MSCDFRARENLDVFAVKHLILALSRPRLLKIEGQGRIPKDDVTVPPITVPLEEAVTRLLKVKPPKKEAVGRRFALS